MDTYTRFHRTVLGTVGGVSLILGALVAWSWYAQLQWQQRTDLLVTQIEAAEARLAPGETETLLIPDNFADQLVLFECYTSARSIEAAASGISHDSASRLDTVHDYPPYFFAWLRNGQLLAKTVAKFQSPRNRQLQAWDLRTSRELLIKPDQLHDAVGLAPRVRPHLPTSPDRSDR